MFVYTAPFTVALLLPRFVPAERLRGVQWLGLVVAFVGVVVAFSESFGHAGGNQLHGDVLALIAGLLWGLTTLAIRTTRLATATPRRRCSIKSASLLPSRRCCRWPRRTLGLAYSGYAWFSIALQTGVGASPPTRMDVAGTALPATRISSFTFLTPLFALVFGVVLLREPLTLQLVLALLGVGAGSCW